MKLIRLAFLALLGATVALRAAPLSAQDFTLPSGLLQTDEPRYPQFNGRTIREISIEVREIFPESELSWLYRTANKLKISTRHEVVKRELLFTEGDRYDDFVRLESIRNLRSLRYLRDIVITPLPVEGADEVDLRVVVGDTWTFIPSLSYSTGDGRTNRSAGLAESDAFGYGKRAEVLVQEEEGRRGLEAVWDDRRVWGSSLRLLGAYFHRVDGNRQVLLFGDPFRSLLQRESWLTSIDRGDTIGRLFAQGSERYIFRQQRTELTTRYTASRGNPETQLFRFSIGYDFIEEDFTQANAKDYEDLDLDPAEVSSDPALLADDRRFSGPVFVVQKINQDYISMNYIDRFERVEDYNLGSEYSGTLFAAPKVLGSLDDALLFSGSHSRGYRFGPRSFIRGEFGGASRYENGALENSLLRFESKYYQVLGTAFWGDLFLGKHTLAVNFFVDYGRDLDRDREFLIGGDNSVRGYSAKTFTGDKRTSFNIEDRIHLADDLFKLVSVGAAVFADVGGATTESLGDLYGDGLYSDVGAGLRFAFPRSSGGGVLRVDVAFPLRDGPDGSNAWEPRIIFSGGQLFGSSLRSESFGPEKANVAVGFDR